MYYLLQEERIYELWTEIDIDLNTIFSEMLVAKKQINFDGKRPTYFKTM